MKKLLFILLLLSACKKIEVQPQPPVVVVQDIFSVAESTVVNGGDIYFDLKAAGIYTLTMLDETQNVITRERISGKVGQNKLKIYTSSLPVKYLYLVLEDQSRTQIGKTTIKIN
jgi:hypothetical protein